MTSLLSSLFLRNELADHRSFEVVRQKNLLNALVTARKRGNAIGIYSKSLGDGMFVTGIEAIFDQEDDPLIQLKTHDIMGTVLIRDMIALSEIKAICAFDMRYKEPHHLQSVSEQSH
jgi:hypothetical protein